MAKSKKQPVAIVPMSDTSDSDNQAVAIKVKKQKSSKKNTQPKVTAKPVVAQSDSSSDEAEVQPVKKTSNKKIVPKPSVTSATANLSQTEKNSKKSTVESCVVKEWKCVVSKSASTGVFPEWKGNVLNAKVLNDRKKRDLCKLSFELDPKSKLPIAKMTYSTLGQEDTTSGEASSDSDLKEKTNSMKDSDDDSSSSEEPVATAVKATNKVVPAVSDSSDSDDSSEEIQTKPVKMAKSAPNAKTAKHESSSDSSDDSDDEPEPLKTKPISKVVASIKGAKADSSSDSSDSSDEESVEPPMKKTTVKAADSSSDSSSDDESPRVEAQVAKQKSVQKSSSKDSDDSSDSSDESVEAPKKQPVKKPVTADTSSSDSDSDESDEDVDMDAKNQNTKEDTSSESSHEVVEKKPKDKKRTASSVETAATRPTKKISIEEKNGGDEKFEVFAGGWPFGTTEDDIRGVFEESCGTVTRVKVLGQGGAAFVQFENNAALESALEWNNTDYKGRTLTINRAGEKPSSGRKGAAEIPNATVIVRNIPFNTNEDQFKKFFSKAGEVVSVKLPIFQDTGKQRGFAMISFSSADEAASAVKLSGSELGGREVTIEVARPRENSRPDSRQSSGFRGGRGGGRGGSGNRGGGARQSSGAHTVFDDE